MRAAPPDGGCIARSPDEVVKFMHAPPAAEKLARALGEERKRKGRGREDDDDDRAGKKAKGAGGSYEVSEEELGEFACSACSAHTREKSDGLTGASRGVSDEPADDGGSHGELRGQGSVRVGCTMSAVVRYFARVPVISAPAVLVFRHVRTMMSTFWSCDPSSIQSISIG